jgi:hypothetical protein
MGTPNNDGLSGWIFSKTGGKRLRFHRAWRSISHLIYDVDPEKRTEPPFVSETDPLTASPSPGAAPSAVFAVQVAPVKGVPGTRVAVDENVPCRIVPTMLMVHEPVGAVFPLPVFVNVRVHTGFTALVHVVTLADTCAVLVKVPNRPKTNPAMAMAAMRVIAMRMTVASTGEMAFLFFL